MAGKPKAPELRKENVLRVRMTADDRELLDKAASLTSLETSTWARSVLIATAKRLITEEGVALRRPRKRPGRSGSSDNR